MNALWHRFDVDGEMDSLRYELSIGVSDKPAVMEQVGSDNGYYQSQVEFYLNEPMGTDYDHSIVITLYQHVNPGYDLAVRQLLGDSLADVAQDTGNEARILQRDMAMMHRGDKSTHEVMLELLEVHINNENASRILNRILVNSTFV